MDLIDKNAKNIPEGDYVEICKVIHFLYEKVKPMTIPANYDPVLDTMTIPANYDPVLDTMTGLTSDETVRRYVQQLHAEWADTD
jgi:hypothetical protein